MSEPRVYLFLDGDQPAHQSGDLLSGWYQLEVSDPAEIDSVELSVLWYTEGTGDEDLKVHFFQRHSADDAARLDLRLPQRFSTRLPNSPLSYEGVIVKIHWCVRVRAFFPRGKSALAEQSFQLGHVPAAQLMEQV